MDDAPTARRTRLVRVLADIVAEALAGGDTVAARIGLDALGKLTGEVKSGAGGKS